MKAAVATRKGLIILKSTPKGWKFDRAHFDGVKVTYVVCDDAKKEIWAGVNHGHWGPKLHVSKNGGKTFEELGVPTFPKPKEKDGKADSLKEIWAWARDSKGRIYVGTDPGAIFYSDDEGKSWTLNNSFYTLDGRDKWFGGGTDGTCVHSILIDPKNDDQITVGVSVGGTIESSDRGKTWKYVNSGLKAYFMPNPDDPVTQDPHLIVRSPTSPNVMYQQNHCGIFKSTNGGREWADLSKAKGLKSAFGWAVEVDAKDPNIAFTIPAVSDEIRVPVKKRLFVQRTKDGGKTWKALSKGLPSEFCYDIVLRHALSKNGRNLIFGSSTGHVYSSSNMGDSWKQLPMQLAPVYAIKILA